jgi:hypothetical protein
MSHHTLVKTKQNKMKTKQNKIKRHSVLYVTHARYHRPSPETHAIFQSALTLTLSSLSPKGLRI